MSFVWDHPANDAISHVAQSNQALAGQIRTAVQQYAQNSAQGWQPNKKYSKSFRAGAIDYRAEYKLEARTGGGSVIHITRVEMS